MDLYEKSKQNTRRYKKLKNLLKIIYGFKQFKPKQYEIMNRIISGEDICAILPTGYGKSLTFQIPALYLDKPAVIISPLISLMNDQRLILDELGITSCCYNSTVFNKRQMRNDILKGEYKFVYLTPESITNMKDFLVELAETQGISLVAIDEAHCISAYGFDFRKSYRDLTFLKEYLPSTPILAVTATATTTVGKDICKVLGLRTEDPIKTSFDRPNLYIEVRKKGRKIDHDIIPIINKYPHKSIIIYCLTKKETSKIQEILKTYKIKSGIYHADLDPNVRNQTHQDFLNDRIQVVVATIAFGMGINKPNVRVVINYGASKNIECYYQQIGRAGRDGKDAYCYAFYNLRDFMIQKSFIASCTDPNYQQTQLRLLEKMEEYVKTNECRRKLLFGYFDEVYDNHCNFCDNCCGKNDKDEIKAILTEQDVKTEAKMLIGLIESIKNRTFGTGMYINILRGSSNKNITVTMREAKYYGTGKHKSIEWWKELIDNLVKLGYLQQVYVNGGRFPMQIIKVTKKGLTWASIADLNGFLDGLEETKLEPIKMVAVA